MVYVIANAIAWRLGNIAGSLYRFLKNILNYLVYMHFLKYGGFIKVAFFKIRFCSHIFNVRYYVLTKNTL